MSKKYTEPTNLEWVGYERRGKRQYRANPNNSYHRQYQRAVTRRILALICLLLLYAASTTYKPLDIVFTFILVIIGIIALVAILAVTGAFVKGLVNWLSGD